jgi:hypothetical protein
VMQEGGPNIRGILLSRVNPGVCCVVSVGEWKEPEN